MSQSKGTVYLERRTYRRRRMMDAARLLPILGIFLFLVPMFRTRDAEDPAMTAGGGLYIFVIWAFLIVAAVLLSRWLVGGEEDVEDAQEDKTGLSGGEPPA